MATTFITVDELRIAVGRASDDPTEAAPFSDQELQAIIDRHKANAEEMIEARVEKRMAEGQVAGSDLFEQQTVNLSPDGPFAVGDIADVEFYPVTSQTAWDEGGNVVSYDPAISTQVPVYFERRRYKLVGKKVHVLPKDTSEITLYVPNRHKTNDRIGADLIRDANQRIIQEARSSMSAMIQEGSRLEGTDYYGSDRDQ